MNAPAPTIGSGPAKGCRTLFVLVASLAVIFLIGPDVAAAKLELKVAGKRQNVDGGSVAVKVKGARGARSVALFVDGDLRRRDRSWPWSFGQRGRIRLPVGKHRIAVAARFRGGNQVRRRSVFVATSRRHSGRSQHSGGPRQSAGGAAPAERVDENQAVTPRRGRDNTEDPGPEPLPGGLVWRGDFETGSTSQWPIRQQVASDRIAIAHDPKRQGNYAARFEVRPGDNIGDTAPRAELAAELGEQEGDERYYRWFTLFDPSFPTEFKDSFVTFTQWRATDESSDYTSFMVWGDRIELRREGTRWSTPLVKGVWHEFIYHVKWSPDPNVGFIELWYDGQLVMPKVNVRTMAGVPGAGVGNYVKQGLYKSDEIPTGIVYHDGFVAGTTLEAVRGA